MSSMNWLRGVFSKADELGEFEAKTSLTATSELTSRLPSPGSRIIIKTTEDKELYLTREDLFLIKSLRRMVDDLGMDSSSEPVVSIPLAMSTEQLEKILVWCRRSQKEEDGSCLFKEECVKELLKYIELAQYLDIGRLADSLAGQVALLLQSMDLEGQRKALGREGKSPCTEEQKKRIEDLKAMFDF